MHRHFNTILGLSAAHAPYIVFSRLFWRIFRWKPIDGKFLNLSEKTRIKLDVYSSMVHTLIRSKKIRPMVKLLLIENIFRMPRKVRFQVISSIREMEGDPECAYLKRELMFMLESRSQSADPRP